MSTNKSSHHHSAPSAAVTITVADLTDEWGRPMLSQDTQLQLEAARALANTVAHELLQPLTVIKAELEIVGFGCQPLDPQTLQRVNQAINEIANRIQAYQALSRFETTQPFPVMTNYKMLVV